MPNAREKDVLRESPWPGQKGTTVPAYGSLHQFVGKGKIKQSYQCQLIKWQTYRKKINRTRIGCLDGRGYMQFASVCRNKQVSSKLIGETVAQW